MFPKRLFAALILLAALAMVPTCVLRAQWVQTNGPRNEILKFGGEVTSLVTIGNDVFAGTATSGVIRSSDSGSSWVAMNNGLSYLGINSLLYSGGVLFAGTSGGGLFFSRDSGGNWSLFPFIDSNFSVTALDVSGSNIIMATKFGNAYLTSDEGSNWTKIGTLANVSCFTSFGTNLFAGEGDGVFLSTDDGANWVPTDTGVIGVNALGVSGSYLFASTYNGIFFSNNNGENWNVFNGGSAVSHALTFSATGDTLYAGTSHGMFLCAFDGISWSAWSAVSSTGLSNPNVDAILMNKGNLYAGTYGGGVFHSTDNGASWIAHNPLKLNLPQINAIDTLADGLWSSTAGGVFFSSDSGASWLIDSNGLGDIPVTAFASENGILFAGTYGNGIFRSTNNGASWGAVDSGLSYEATFVSTLIANNGTLYTGSSNSIFVSTDDGISWLNPAGANQGVDAISFEIFGKYQLASTQSGVQYSPDSGKDWYPVQSGPPSGSVNTLTILGGKIFAGTSQYGVWLSNDSGNDWVESDSGITDPDITCLLSYGGVLFAGTIKGGVFISSDSGASWSSIDSGFPASSAVTSLAVKDSNLYAGTTDTGIWRHSLSHEAPASVVAQSPAIQPDIQIFPNPFTRSTQITFSSQASGYADISVVNTLGVEIARIFSGELGAGEHSFTWENPTGLPDGAFECVVRINGQLNDRSSTIQTLPVMLKR